MKRSNKLLLLMGILNPILYLINPYLLLLGIIIELFYIFSQPEEFEIRFWKAYLLCSTYFGINIFGMKIYDCLALVCSPFILLAIHNRKEITKSKFIYVYIMLSFIVYIGINVIINGASSNTILDYFRYIQSLLIFLVVLKTIKDLHFFSKFFPFIYTIAVKNIFSGILIVIMGAKKLISYDFNDSIYSVLLHNVNDEFRIAAFFSDPNKYFLFFIILLIVYECNSYMKKDASVLNKGNIILSIPILLSFSRTAWIIVIVFFFLKLINIRLLKGNQKSIFLFNYLLFFGAISSYLFFKDFFFRFINQVLYFFTILLGRDHTLKLFTDGIAGDNRMISSTVAIDSVKDNLLIGKGLSYWKEIYYMPPHNAFISMFQETGTIGLLFFITIILFSVKRVPVFIIGPLLFIPLFTLDIQTYRMFFVVIALLSTTNFKRAIVSNKPEATLKRSLYE